MPRLTDVQRSTLATFWNLATDFASNGLTASEFVKAANDHANQFGETLSFAENTALGTLYGYARRMSNAAGAAQSALDSAFIGPDEVATPPWARDEAAMLATPIWHVSYQFTYINPDGEQVTDYKTSVFEMTLPGTIGDLRDAITEDAEALAEKYGFQFVDASLVQILTV